MEAPGCWGLLLALGLLRGAAATAATEAPPAHVLSRVLFCQPDRPSQGLADTFDGDQLFSFDFPGARWEPRLPDFQPWVGAQESTEQIRNDSRLCQHLLLVLTNVTTGFLPEARGTRPSVPASAQPRGPSPRHPQRSLTLPCPRPEVPGPRCPRLPSPAAPPHGTPSDP
ncbi:class II histocompatibility antigen, M alpha chain [Chelonia mydas]|uniref:class II histocompatibility antigen, M alpha chain n=1 Tax=Chelonia mydas TaxID=8469 RepID=UPI001CA8B1D5|nr:class II histocompatibility antigen, M alpha chain [Chelonia mydas]